VTVCLGFGGSYLKRYCTSTYKFNVYMKSNCS